MGRRGGRVLGTACSLCQRGSRSRDGMRRVLAPPSRRRRVGWWMSSFPRIWTRPHAPSGRVSGRHFVNRSSSAGGPLEPQNQVCGNPTSATFRMFGAGNDHRRPERVAIAAARSFVRITGSPRNRAASVISDHGRSSCFTGYSGSRPLAPPATGCHDHAMVRLPAPGLEFGCFQIAYGTLRCLDGRIVGVATHASRGWRIQGRVRRRG